jgi:hypothetical protein
MNFGLFQTYFTGVSKWIDPAPSIFTISSAKPATYEEMRLPRHPRAR